MRFVDEGLHVGPPVNTTKDGLIGAKFLRREGVIASKQGLTMRGTLHFNKTTLMKHSGHEAFCLQYLFRDILTNPYGPLHYRRSGR